MNMSFRKPAPARVVVEVDHLNRLIAEVDRTRDDVAAAILLLESGRPGEAVKVLRQAFGRLS